MHFSTKNLGKNCESDTSTTCWRRTSGFSAGNLYHIWRPVRSSFQQAIIHRKWMRNKKLFFVPSEKVYFDQNCDFQEAWLRPQRGWGHKCIFSGFSVRSSIYLYGSLLNTRNFCLMRTVVWVLQRTLFKLIILIISQLSPFPLSIASKVNRHLRDRTSHLDVTLIGIIGILVILLDCTWSLDLSINFQIDSI